MTNSYQPIFDPEGKYLYFLSDRDYNEVLGNIDFEFANPKTTRVYIATLRKDEASPFPALSDETEVKKEEPAPAAEAKAESKERKRRAQKGKGKDKDKDKDKRRRKRSRRSYASISMAFRTALSRCRPNRGYSRLCCGQGLYLITPQRRCKDCRGRSRERQPGCRSTI